MSKAVVPNRNGNNQQQAQQQTSYQEKPSERKEASPVSSISHIMMLQRTAGNQAVSEMVRRMAVQQTASNPVIQRSLDDSAKKKWKDSDLSALWVKMRNRSEGKDNLPSYGTVRDDMAQYVDRELTERALAEEIINTEPFKAMFLTPRLAQSEDAIANPNGTIEQAIKKILDVCIFYHVTFTENVEAIAEGGIKANKGGKGSGVSTHGRDDPEANATYNKWSKGHTFITKSTSEAAGYKAKMEESGKTAKILHILSNPTFTKNEMKVDIDSKAGLKYEGDLKAVGDRTQLNQTAISLVVTALREMNLNADASKINEVYAAHFS